MPSDSIQAPSELLLVLSYSFYDEHAMVSDTARPAAMYFYQAEAFFSFLGSPPPTPPRENRGKFSSALVCSGVSH